MDSKKWKSFFYIVFAINLIWVLFLNSNEDKTMIWNYLFNVSYSVLFIGAGVFAIGKSINREVSLVLNKTLFSIGVGSLMWGIGLVVWFAYNMFSQVEVPFPSWADAFFVMIYPFVGWGCYQFINMFKGLITPKIRRESFVLVGVAALAVWFWARPDLSPDLSLLQNVISVIYPLGDLILAAMALVMLRISAGQAKFRMQYLVLALITQSAADFLFTARTASGIYWNGDMSDVLFMVAAFMLSLAVVDMATFQKAVLPKK